MAMFSEGLGNTACSNCTGGLGLILPVSRGEFGIWNLEFIKTLGAKELAEGITNQGPQLKPPRSRCSYLSELGAGGLRARERAEYINIRLA